MNRKYFYLLIIPVCMLAASAGCGQKESTVVNRPENTFSVKGSVREMSIQPETVDFPEHDGKKEFTMYCGICHSLRYISTQPNFPKKTWEAEVTKMVAKYKAPVDSVVAKKIVDYLVAVKGPMQKAG